MNQPTHDEGAEHQRVQALLPWYATGALEADDRQAVEAHLPGCRDCETDLGLERRLAAEVAAMSLPAEQDWARLRDRIAAPAVPMRQSGPRRPGGPFGGTPAWLGWAVAAQFAALMVLVAVVAQPERNGRYHTLGASSAPAAANVIVMFRPQATEAQMRAAIRRADGRLVGGPTAADAYLLAVPAPARDGALAALRRQPAIALAEPIDAGPDR